MLSIPLLAALLGADATPSATPAATVGAAPAVPFTFNDLEKAIALRLSPDAPPVLVRVQPIEAADAVRITVNDKERVVPLGGRVGTAAARWVALAALDLTFAEAAPQRPPPGPMRDSRFVAYLLPSWGVGTDRDAALVGVSAGTSLRISLGLRGTFDTGYVYETPSTLTDSTAHILDVRGGLAWLFRRLPIELRLGFFVRPYWVNSSFLGRTTDSGILIDPRGVAHGVGAAVLYYLPAGRITRFLFAAGVDIYTSRNEHYALDGMTLHYRNEPAVFYAGLGVGFSP